MENLMEKRFYILSICVLAALGIGLYHFRTLQREDAVLAKYSDVEEGILDDSNADLYPRNIDLVDYYAGGAERSCYFIPQVPNPYINALYYFMDPDGRVIEDQMPIVYIKPGDPAYGEMWEIFHVHVPRRYVPNSVKSIHTILEAEKDKVFSVTFSGMGVNMPIVSRDVKIQDHDGNFPRKIDIYYNKKRATALQFETSLAVSEVKKIDTMPVVSVWRDGDKESLFEKMWSKDMSGDTDLRDSVNVASFERSHPSYTPIWKLSFIHVKNTYPTLSDPQLSVKAWKSFDQLVSDIGRHVNFKKGVNGLEETKFLFNCPQIPK
ncbi:MAG: hypothetical protein G01um101418_73 [Parcubacteria group bacterium Gr01-1014_18]|nr:MAG: hypothetical protein Greene041636_73 [Parcubacteria group bacterium Greene0416_36]TSC81579.1 MAG: hypothetical protein G01um101418_73 [Parcubacteria group bacterium Gr01-1014_18]TSC99610.1 MAG: hypothetical protein Greene101420_14 [Parcubacteria group bacterium Greene1014_20]TSD07061.1 MAG: hypothetical protein Greene07142_373 [Parcubacteria group bacterium Greene0714_2]